MTSDYVELTNRSSLDQWIASTGAQVPARMQGLNNSQRAEVYNYLQEQYPHLQIEHRTLSSHPLHITELFLRRTEPCEEGKVKKPVHHTVKIDTELIKEFETYSRIPIPIPDPERLPYYLKRLDPCYDAQNQWQMFLADVTRAGSLSQWRYETAHHKNRIINYWKEHPWHAELMQELGHDHKTRTEVSDLPCQNLLQASSSGHFFLSLDVKKANFSVLRHYNQQLVNSHGPAQQDLLRGASTWTEFLTRMGITSPFLQQSKQFRSVVFGYSNFVKYVTKGARMFIRVIMEEFERSPLVSHFEHFRHDDDEVIYKLTGDLTFVEQELPKFSKRMEALAPGQYHIDFYNLLKIGGRHHPHDVFVKTYTDGTFEFGLSQKARLDWRSCILQCVAKYEDTPVVEWDLEHLHSCGEIVSFKKSIFH